MVATQTGTVWFENFVYSTTANTDTWTTLPPALEYRITARTSDGHITMPAKGSTGWVIRNGNGRDNEDAAYPYGGVGGRRFVPSLPGSYLRSPVLTWNQQTGVLFQPKTTTKLGVFEWDMSFTGHSLDRIYVLTLQAGRWSQPMRLTGKSGFGWVRNSIALPKGTSAVMIVLKTPTWAEAVKTYKVPPSDSATLAQPMPLQHRLRLTNFRVTSSSGVVTPINTRTRLAPDSALTADVELNRVLKADLLADSALVLAAAVSPHLDLLADSTLTPTDVDSGVELEGSEATFHEDSFLITNPEINALNISETGGFQVGSRMGIAVQTTILPTIADYIRPLMTTTITMTRPAIVKGIPTTPRARSLTTVATSVGNAGTTIGRISPATLDHVYPAPGGGLTVQPTFRWLSIDAIYSDEEDTLGELIEWPEHTDRGNTPGPSWSTPGAFRPYVASYVMDTDAKHRAINFPAVNFDGTRLDHLNIDMTGHDHTTLQNGSESFTWFIVGDFTRFRGELRDSCPIIDFTATKAIDYTEEDLAERGTFQDWYDPADNSHPTCYTGWHAFADTNPETSTMVWRGSNSSPASSRRVVYNDNQPVVLAICVSGGQSYTMLMPILGGGPIPFPPYQPASRQALSAMTMPTTFTLGKARNIPPYSGLFGTGSMSLLEIAYYNQALTPAQAETICRYLGGVYAPASLIETRTNPPIWNRSLKPVKDGELLFSGQLVGDPYFMLHQGIATEVPTANFKTLPLAHISQGDYENFIAFFQEDE